jgi:hypothetical protein
LSRSVAVVDSCPHVKLVDVHLVLHLGLFIDDVTEYIDSYLLLDTVITSLNHWVRLMSYLHARLTLPFSSQGTRIAMTSHF